MLNPWRYVMEPTADVADDRYNQAREETCLAFFGIYCNKENDFPSESRQNSYRERLATCCPIHPELFDYLYDKWTGYGRRRAGDDKA